MERAMSQIILVFFSLVMVIGCDKQVSDNFAIKQPSITTSDKTGVKISEATLKVPGTMKLSDEIQFEGVAPEITLSSISTCRLTETGYPFEAVYERPLPQKIAIYQLLPPKALYDASFTQSTNISCSVKFSAKNKNGSTHNFELKVQIFRDPGDAIDTQLRQNTTILQLGWSSFYDKPRKRIVPEVNEHDLFALTLGLQDAEMADLRCTSFSETIHSGIIPFQGPVDLRTFSWHRQKPELQQKRVRNELCRVIGYNKTGITSVSPYFYVKSNLPRVHVSRTTFSIPYLHTVKYQTPTKEALYQAIHLTNEEDFPVQVSLPKKPTVEANILTHHSLIGWPRSRRVVLPDYQLLLKIPNSPERSLVNIPPKQSQWIEVYLPTDYSCHDALYDIGIAMVLDFSKQGSQIGVIDGNGEPYFELPVLFEDGLDRNILLTAPDVGVPSAFRNYGTYREGNTTGCRQNTANLNP